MEGGRKVLIAGGSGLIGRELTTALRSAGCDVRILSRRNSKDHFCWNVEKQIVDARAFEGIDAIFNLAGAGIADRPWTNKRKKILYDSRIDGTRFLAETCSRLGVKLRTYVGASAIGFYGGDEFENEFGQGERGKEKGEERKEDSAPGNGFLANLCAQWEKEHLKFSSIATSVVICRISNVLSSRGGLLLPFIRMSNLGMAIRIAPHNKSFTWIHIADIVAFMKMAAEKDYSGIYNLAARNLTWREFQEKFYKCRGRQFLKLSIPASIIKLGMGEMSSLLLDGCRASGQKLRSLPFQTHFNNLDDAFSDLLNRS